MRKSVSPFQALGTSGCPPCEAWRLGWMFYELWWTSAYNITTRTAWLSGMVPGADPMGAAALKEWQRMWNEKLWAGVGVGLELQRVGRDLCLGRLSPGSSGSRVMRPVHKRTVANAKRLSRRDRIGT